MIKPGWPFSNGKTKFSFQSPILIDLDGKGGLEIIGESHGDQPEFFVLNGRGDYLPNWQKPVPQNRWTFHTPTVIHYQDQAIIFTARPISDAHDEMLYAWTSSGTLLPGFPISKSGGLEGLITVGDVDDDQAPEILFSSNIFDSTGHGYIHAYNLDGSGDIDGFPLRPKGLTFLNGATIGDIDGDAMMDLVVLSYTEHPDNELDTTFLHVYELEVPYANDRVWWSTYKGSNLRDGRVSSRQSTALSQPRFAPQMRLYPNPTSNLMQLRLPAGRWRIRVLNLDGKICLEIPDIPGALDVAYDISQLAEGFYMVQAQGMTGSRVLLPSKLIIQ